MAKRSTRLELTLVRLYPKLISSATADLLIVKNDKILTLLEILKKSIIHRFYLNDMIATDLISSKKRFEIKENHPMYGKKHTKESLSLISKPNELNPMFGRTHSESSKRLISEKANKYPKGVGLYDLNNNLILTFKNNVELGKYVNITKSTVGKYMKEGKVYKNKYIFKPIE